MLRRASQSAGRVALAAALAGVAIVAALALSVFPDVYQGIPRSVAVSTITATCQPVSNREVCAVAVVRLNPGRFYLSASGPTSVITVTIDEDAIARSHAALIRADAPGQLTFTGAEGAVPLASAGHDVRKAGERVVVDLGAVSSRWQHVTFRTAAPLSPLVISELGFFADAGALASVGPFRVAGMSAVTFYSTIAVAVTLSVAAFIVVAVWLFPEVMRGPAPWLLTVLCLAICILDLGTMFSPHWSRDIRSMYGAEVVQSGASGNLTGGLYEGSRLVQGLGLTEEAGTVPWHRMPGYGLFCALAARLGRTTDVVEIAAIVVVLQVLFYAAAVGVFVAVARGALGVRVACLIGILITLLPKQLNYTQVDSVIAPTALLLTSAILWMLSVTPPGERPGFGPLLLVNAAFASWFLIRNDVLVGWIVVSAALAGWRWRRLAVPVALIAAIALPWALYKRQYRHEFNLMPTNTGEVLFLSLCEVPGAFPYECTDNGYFAWTRRLGGVPSSQRTSNRAIAEVVRHWLTYPVHFGFMVLVKARRSIVDEAWPGFRTRLSALYGDLVPKASFAVLLTLVGLSLAVDHQRRRTLWVGWPLILNMPIFFVVFASYGRFYSAAGVSLLVAAVPLLFERGLPAQICRHPWRAGAVVAAAVLFIAGGPLLERWVAGHDSIHYATPWLDPDRSTLPFVVR